MSKNKSYHTVLYTKTPFKCINSITFATVLYVRVILTSLYRADKECVIALSLAVMSSCHRGHLNWLSRK